MTEHVLIAFGALGLILLGMDWMSGGLKSAAGPKFLQALENWTTTPARGLMFGTSATIAAQSSSAITVATIGFVNAGVLTLEKAAFVIYGSNVGTSLTGWFIALVGIEFKIDAFALPLIGLGALLKLFASKSALRGIGDALIGFGALFLGLAFLKSSFDASGISLDMPFIADAGVVGLFLAILIGTALTTLMQASVAVIALVLTAVSTGTMELTVAAAFIVGANLGTTSTAIMSTLAATSNAKRLAWLHVIFNLITAMVAVALMAPILGVISWIEIQLNLSTTPAISLAIFHSLFNVMGVVLMWPLTPRIVDWLKHRFKGDKIELKYVDSSTLSLPDTAIKALANELNDQLVKLGHVVGQTGGATTSLEKILGNIQEKQKRIAVFLDKLSEVTLNHQQARALTVLSTNLLRIDTVAAMAPKLNLALSPFNDKFQLEKNLWQTLTSSEYDSVAFRKGYRDYVKGIEKQKQSIYTAVLEHQLSHSKASELMVAIHELKRMNVQLIKASTSLRKLIHSYA
ncbi:Sodium-dependent phosphate transporter [Pseudoalteromonas luteoviolacea B = ATCC 29581]|nr:Sodium-dependent phosphate transporter [Pseudoalteromonas luteoviolacea B = ATCC 29581]